ncbi:5415_t:CDS:2 [Ambispora leptoticha]|uniref:5415_t:CDS:1 n=1 Tax=Ambispora leptoticha TaxID=144679 RepID=A0A9N8WFB8_9GLOM|nr:5415_t:CDS:2 [Ambispora leptoticha]
MHVYWNNWNVTTHIGSVKSRIYTDFYARCAKPNSRGSRFSLVLPCAPRLGGLGGTNIKPFYAEGGGIYTYEGIDLDNPDICPREDLREDAFCLCDLHPWLARLHRPNFCEECKLVKTIPIIDEVQMLYSKGLHEPSYHGGDAFLSVVKNCRQFGQLCIVSFAVYGYQGAWDGSMLTMDVSPIAINLQNTWSLENVRFTDEEYNDYISCFCKKYFGNMKDDDALCLQQYVYNMTDRHPGLSHSSWTLFQPAIEVPKRGFANELTLKTIIEKKGKFEFAAPYLCVLYMRERWEPLAGWENLRSFIIDTFIVMDTKALQKSFGVGKDKRLLERVWQMEFYRSATQVLPNDINISPNVGSDFGSRGFVGFYVDDDRDD